MPAVVVQESSNLRKSIRDTERLLSRPNLPATIRQMQERKLASLQSQLEDKARAERLKSVVSKYRMVRFFESKKSIRRLRQAVARDSQADILEAQKDALYVKFYPKDQKYISLWPSEPCADDQALAKRAQIREDIFAAHSSSQDLASLLTVASNSGSHSSKRKNAEVQSDGDEDMSDEGDEDDLSDDEDDASDDEDEVSDDEDEVSDDEDDVSDDEDDVSDEDDLSDEDDFDDEDDDEELSEDDEEFSEGEDDDEDSSGGEDDEESLSEGDLSEEDDDEEDDLESDEEEFDSDEDEDDDSPNSKRSRH